MTIFLNIFVVYIDFKLYNFCFFYTEEVSTNFNSTPHHHHHQHQFSDSCQFSCVSRKSIEIYRFNDDDDTFLYSN